MAGNDLTQGAAASWPRVAHCGAHRESSATISSDQLEGNQRDGIAVVAAGPAAITGNDLGGDTIVCKGTNRGPATCELHGNTNVGG